MSDCQQYYLSKQYYGKIEQEHMLAITIYKIEKKKINSRRQEWSIRVIQMFCIISLHTTLRCIYKVTETV